MPPARRDSRRSGTISPSSTRSARSPSCRKVLRAKPLDGGFAIAAVKAVAPAIGQLLDREEGDQRARQWDRRVKRGQRRHRRHSEIAESREKIEVSEIDHA